MDKSQYDFPVEMVSIATSENGIVIPKKFAVIRTDSNTPLGIVSDKYSFLKHTEVIDGFREALEGQNYTEKIILQKDGAQLFAEYTLKDVQAEVEKGDIIGMKLVAKNSYDGSAQLYMSLGSVRLICKNGMTMTRNFIEFSHKHVGEHIHLDVGEVRENLGRMIQNFKGTIPHMQNMGRVHLEQDIDQLFDPKKVKLPTYLLKEAVEEYKKANDNTVWGHYNAMTFAITHKMRKDESVALQEIYGAIAWEVALKELQLA